jgi:hypothetical protein
VIGLEEGEAPPLPCKRCLRFGPGMAEQRCLAAACPVLPAAGRKVVSTSLYGGDRRYTGGAVRNAELAPVIFPGWELRFYVKDDVPPAVLAEIRALGSEVRVVSSADVGFGMNWRFLVADDAAVDAFVCRDADSRVSLRDRYAVEDWVASGEHFHVVRDHPSHAALQIMGGTWGARRAGFAAMGTTLHALLSSYVARTGNGEGYLADINFLDTVWPAMLKHGLMQHDSHSCGAGRHGPLPGRPFPRPRAGAEHVGAVYIYEQAGFQGREAVRQGDLDILVRERESPACAPQSTRAGAEREEVGLASMLSRAEPVPWRSMALGEALPGALVRTAWRQAGGALYCAAAGAPVCDGGASPAQPVLLRWRDAFVDHEKATRGAVYSAVFDFDRHLLVGAPRGRAVGTRDDIVIPQYHERVPQHLEPYQALDGGVRYYTSLLVPSQAFGEPGTRGVDAGDEAAVASFVREDLPRLLRALPPETIALLPAGLFDAAERAVSARVAGGEISSAQAGALLAHLVRQEGPPILYYARDVFISGCGCATQS